MEWEREWTDEVQKVLEMDAGWGWKGFWECVEENVKVSVSVGARYRSPAHNPSQGASWDRLAVA